MSYAVDCLAKAEKECTKRIDVNPDKVLRPVGTKFDEWYEPSGSTDIPHWQHWEVVAHIKSFRGRRGNALLYEQMEEIRLC